MAQSGRSKSITEIFWANSCFSSPFKTFDFVKKIYPRARPSHTDSLCFDTSFAFYQAFSLYVGYIKPTCVSTASTCHATYTLQLNDSKTLIIEVITNLDFPTRKMQDKISISNQWMIRPFSGDPVYVSIWPLYDKLSLKHYGIGFDCMTFIRKTFNIFGSNNNNYEPQYSAHHDSKIFLGRPSNFWVAPWHPVWPRGVKQNFLTSLLCMRNTYFSIFTLF